MREACVVSAKNTETATINPTPALPHGGRGQIGGFLCIGSRIHAKNALPPFVEKTKARTPNGKAPSPCGGGWGWG